MNINKVYRLGDKTYTETMLIGLDSKSIIIEELVKKFKIIIGIAAMCLK